MNLSVEHKLIVNAVDIGVRNQTLSSVITKLGRCIVSLLSLYQSSTLQRWVVAASHPSQRPHSLDDLLPEPGAEQAVDEDVDGGVEHEEELREGREDLHQIFLFIDELRADIMIMRNLTQEVVTDKNTRLLA